MFTAPCRMLFRQIMQPHDVTGWQRSVILTLQLDQSVKYYDLVGLADVLLFTSSLRLNRHGMHKWPPSRVSARASRHSQVWTPMKAPPMKAMAATSTPRGLEDVDRSFFFATKSATAEKLLWNDICCVKNLTSSESNNSLSLCADNIFTFHIIFIKHS